MAHPPGENPGSATADVINYGKLGVYMTSRMFHVLDTYGMHSQNNRVFTVRKRSCGKVMFSHLSVSHSVHRGGDACSRGVCMAGACMAGGMCAWGVCGRGACMAGGMCGRGSACWGACVAGETATAVEGTHPTGMLSCS